jgi:tetratricopeptide (TPR) repeat protein
MVKSDDVDFEIQFYEGILEKKGDFFQALMALGNLYTQKGLYEKGLAVDEKLVRLRPKDPLVLYNLACSYSLLNKINKAFKAMKDAISCGYDDFDYLESDGDLANLLENRKFRKYLLAIKDKYKKAENL